MKGKKINNLICMLAVVLLGVLVLCAACAPQASGTFYSLEEAYENGWLTRDDLQEIADLHNANTQCAEKPDGEIAELIKKAAAWELKNDEKSPIVEAKAEDFTILKYYGVYHQDCYVVMLDEPYFEFPAVEVDEWKEIGGVQFHITSFYEIKVWKK